MAMGTCCSAHGNILIAIFLSLTPLCLSLNFQLPTFSSDDTAILLEGDAVISVGKIEFNKVNYIYRVGRVIYNGRVPLWASNSNSNSAADFTTHFSFIIDTQNRSTHGQGIAFFLAPAGFQIPPNSGGGFLGLFNTTTTGTSSSQIVSVEFDSFPNSGEWDPPYEHVGINRNSIASSVTTPWNSTLHDGEAADVWITYAAATTNLSVFWSYHGGSNSSLSYKINLREVLPQFVTVGISAATGYNVERHILESWEFTSSVDIGERSGNNEKKVGLIVGLAIGAFVVVGIAVVGYAVVKKRRRGAAPRLISIGDDDLERGAGPRRFSYKELASATNNFSEDRKQGEGGFGGVYKGHLIGLDMPVAVKRISKGSRQGKKEYTAEVKTIGMLRHRNLVQLIGWCHDQGEFMLVYEFMPNGSLDRHLFGRKTSLDWNLRFRISTGLASALLYLHEEWEQCVVHRDIKSSNVMLDSRFSVKLGDFGLARLMDHGVDPKTTGLAGTLGYLAPEYVSSGRASKESDVYSFGVVALEITTGRRSTDPVDEHGLVAWVWDLYGNGELLSGADGRLQGDFDPRQVERVMVVGLWCAHPDWNLRPSIREASHVLNLEKEMPKLPHKMPMPVYQEPPPLAHAYASTSSAGSAEPFITSSSINIGR